jgi:GAF domain-containing protein
VDSNRLDELCADRIDRIERVLWVLKDVCDTIAADLAQSLRRKQREIAVVEADIAANDLAWWRGYESRDRLASDGLAGAAFADETDRLASMDIEADPIDRSDGSIAGMKVRPKLAHRKQ